MDFEDALQGADRLAAKHDVRLGKCLFEIPVDGGWLLIFDTVGGPPEWSWFVRANEAGQDEEFFAIRVRPSPSLMPRIRRQWLSGRRKLKLPYRQRLLSNPS
jgi:hypothetical protein